MRYPLSFAQQRIWALTRSAPDDPALLLTRTTALDGPVDLGALQRAMDAMVARHAILRTSVVTSVGQPVQVVADTGAVSIEQVAADRPFDIEQASLLRAALVEDGSDRSRLVVVAHRIIADDAALAILLDELCTVYKSDSATLPALWMDYGDYAVWQREWLTGEELARQLAPWREPLPKVVTLPTDRPRPAEPSARAALETAELDPALVRRLVALAQRQDTTLDRVVLAGYAVALARYARQTELVLTVPVSGRIRVELATIVGPFADAVPVRVSLAGVPSFAELVERVRDGVETALCHQELPLDKLADELGIDFPVDVDLAVVGAGTLSLSYRAEVVDPALAGRFLRSVVTVLDHAGARPETPVGRLPLLSAAEARPVAWPAEVLDLWQLLRESSATVGAGAETVPMSAVCARAARLAGVLAGRGVGPEVRVGVCVGRGVGLVVALLGVWWAGGAIVGLDPELPLSRLATMARAAELRLVVADPQHAELAGSLGEVIALDASAEPLEPVVLAADSLAYTVFTGGPLGVDVPFRAVTNLLGVLRRDLGLAAGERFLAVSTGSFDLVLVELVLPLVCGADLVIGRDVGGLRALVEAGGVTALHAAPHVWRQLLASGGVPAGVRLRLWSGDDEPPPELGEAWRLYGHPETGVWSAVGRDGLRPIDGTRVEVLDEWLTPVPDGAIGQVHIAGVGVARGYLGAGAFGADPYATGDVGRWRADGRLELVGRIDRRVVIRGVRVECGEVEGALTTHREIRDAVVLSSAPDGEPALVAYVVPEPDGPAALPNTDLLALLRPHLRATLPEPMVPALFVALPALPRTPDDTVDLAALPAPDWASVATSDRVLPRDPVEATIAGIWAELLHTSTPIGVHDNLFGLGGRSLTAVRFAARVADTYGVQVPMHQIVAMPTVAALAELVTGLTRADETTRADELTAMSDAELDDLLRAVLAARDRRRADQEEAP